MLCKIFKKAKRLEIKGVSFIIHHEDHEVLEEERWKEEKDLLAFFTTLMVINLQFNTPLTKGMDDGFSLSQLVENVFVQESYAESYPGTDCWFIDCDMNNWNKCRDYAPAKPCFGDDIWYL